MNPLYHCNWNRTINWQPTRNMVKTGTGTLTLTQPFLATGPLTVNNGKLTVASTIATGNSTITIATGATLSITNGSATSYGGNGSGSITGGGTLQNDSSAQHSLPVTLTVGTVKSNSGGWNFNLNGATHTSNIVMVSGFCNFSAATTVQTFTGAFSGTGTYAPSSNTKTAFSSTTGSSTAIVNIATATLIANSKHTKTPGKFAILTVNARLTFNSIGGTDLTSFSCTAAPTGSVAWGVNMLGALTASVGSTFTLLEWTGTNPTGVPVTATNTTGRTFTYAWVAGTGLVATIAS